MSAFIAIQKRGCANTRTQSVAKLIQRWLALRAQVRRYNGATQDIVMQRPVRTLESPVAASLEERERGKARAYMC